MADARNEDAVRRLRERKQREEKPFAVMYPSLDAVRADCRVSDVGSAPAGIARIPIVLLQKTRAVSLRRLLPAIRTSA